MSPLTYLPTKSLFRSQDHLGNMDQLAILVAGQFLHGLESAGFVAAGPLHEHSLGPFDELAVLQGLAEIAGLLLECLELLEAAHGDDNGRLQVLTLDRLYQVGPDGG